MSKDYDENDELFISLIRLFPRCIDMNTSELNRVYETFTTAYFSEYEFYSNRRNTFTRLLNFLGLYNIKSSRDWFKCDCCGSYDYIEYEVEIPNSDYYIRIFHDTHFGGKTLQVRSKSDEKFYMEFFK